MRHPVRRVPAAGPQVSRPAPPLPVPLSRCQQPTLPVVRSAATCPGSKTRAGSGSSGSTGAATRRPSARPSAAPYSLPLLLLLPPRPPPRLLRNPARSAREPRLQTPASPTRGCPLSRGRAGRPSVSGRAVRGRAPRPLRKPRQRGRASNRRGSSRRETLPVLRAASRSDRGSPICLPLCWTLCCCAAARWRAGARDPTSHPSSARTLGFCQSVLCLHLQAWRVCACRWKAAWSESQSRRPGSATTSQR